MAETLVILDFGSQYTQLIARRTRELDVFSIILPYSASAEEIRKHSPLGIVLSGGPNSVYDRDAPQINDAVFGLNIPILGICYGLQTLARALGGTVEASPTRKYGKATLKLEHKSKLLAYDYDNSTVWMSHGDHVAVPPEGFHATAVSGGVICAIEDPQLDIFGLQFHPEVAHTEYGQQILENFIGLCGFKRDWSAKSIIEQQVEAIRKHVGTSKVVCALSGGVDSSVAATLVDRAVGDQQECIFVDTGLLRKDEYEEVLAAYKKIGLNVTPVRAGKRFLEKLKGVSDPEKKRKIIGAEFISTFEKRSQTHYGCRFSRARHAVPGCYRVGIGQRAVCNDQVAPQCRRTTGKDEPQAHRAFKGIV